MEYSFETNTALATRMYVHNVLCRTLLSFVFLSMKMRAGIERWEPYDLGELHITDFKKTLLHSRFLYKKQFLMKYAVLVNMLCTITFDCLFCKMFLKSV